MNIWVESFINTFLAATLLTIVVCALLRWTPGLNAATRYAAWWVTLAAVVAIPVGYSLWPAQEIHSPVTMDVSSNRTIGADEPTATEPIRIDPDSLPLAAIGWTLGSLIMLVRLAAGYRYLRNLKSKADPLSFPDFAGNRKVRVLESSQVVSPIAVGFRRPAVIVPSRLAQRLSEEELDRVLVHEYAHLIRRDDWMNLLARTLQGLLWFHPLAWFILRRIAIERELACDAWVVHQTGNARAYAAVLLKLTQLRQQAYGDPVLATGILGQRTHLSHRIEELSKMSRRLVPVVSRARLGLASAVILLCTIGALQSPAFITFDQSPQKDWQEPLVEPRTEPIEQATEPTPDPQPVPAAHEVQDPSPEPGRILRVLTVAEQAPAPPAPAVSPAPKARPNSSETPAAPAAAPAREINPREGFLAGLKAAGYTNLDVEEIIELKNHGVSPNYIAEMTSILGRVPVKQLVQLRVHGVRPSHVRQAKQFKNELTIDQIVRLKNSGVLD